MKRWVMSCLLAGSSGVAFAADFPPVNDALLWLNRMAHAARQLNYSGTYVAQSANRVETTRITHLNDGGNELEKLEALDGQRRETVRNNEELTCYIPDGKVIRREKRGFRRSFPAMLPSNVSNLTENYTARKLGIERVAGLDCQEVILEPKDQLRYRQKFCADLNHALILRAMMLDERDEIMEQFAFTHVQIGIAADKELLKSRFADQRQEWRVDQITAAPLFPTEVTWTYGAAPAGFKKVAESRRAVSGRPSPVNQVVFSDGLVRVSVFIDPHSSQSAATGSARQGNVNVYTRRMGDFQVTALGEVPVATVQQLANMIQGKP